MTSVATGAWAASLTPLNADLSIDTGAFLAHVQWLLGSGAAGVVALGTTGEANSFSLDERSGLVAALGKSGIAPERMMIGTGCCAIPDTVVLTRAALDAGFANVLMLPPFYYKGASDDGIFDAYAAVIERVRDADLKIFVYDIPQQTGLTLSVDLLARLQQAFPRTVVGVKNSSGDWSAMAAACALPGFQVFAGSEEFLLATLRAGGPGCISATANVTCGRLSALAARWRSDDADALQADTTRARRMLQKYPMIPALKALMAEASRREGWRRLRPPLVNLAQADLERLVAEAQAARLLHDVSPP